MNRRSGTASSPVSPAGAGDSRSAAASSPGESRSAARPGVGESRSAAVSGAAGSGPAATARGARRDGASERWRAACFILAATAIVGGLAWALLGSSLLVVRSVQVTGVHLVSTGAVLRAAAIQRGTPLIQINGASVALRVEKLTPVLSAQVSRDWPDKIVITVRERSPAFAVAVGGGFGLVDEFGVIVRELPAKPSGMPLLTAPVPAPGVWLRGNPAVRAAVIVLNELPAKLRDRVRSVSAPSADAVTVRLNHGVTILWGGSDRAAAKARELSILVRAKAHYYDVSDPTVAVTGE